MQKNDLSRSLVAFDQNNTLVAVVELSLKTWLVSGLVPDNYGVEFKSVTNYYDRPELTVPIIGGQTSRITNYYASASALVSGQLTIVINPPSVATNANVNQRGRWHLQGEGPDTWYDSGQTISNLNAGGQTVEFKDIPNFIKPRNREVRVFSHQANLIDDASSTYLIKAAPGAITPGLLNFAEVTDINWPYLHNGQIQTDVGLSSGVVVKERVVLTAAHVLFNDSTLEWVTEVRWFFQQHAGDYQAVAQMPSEPPYIAESRISCSRCLACTRWAL